ncbi:hypothetical protein CJ739_72 [Mariniflexile rhizosphaerae]|uniref:hypothetical protein n=1 Tax=unclassified Mariniflexile TaxID=2643887 RepID=UPI000E32F702|nr:hypothetical protein [Mariniflexile sp. TRM1-10]AXP79172.1 hypothetical protein CJ739_72 [Mariniflexile sp. TRM1-10]
MSTTKEAPKGKEQQKGIAILKPVERAKTNIDDVLNPTAESRLKKLDTFKILAEKHKYLVSKNDDLQKFIASSDGMKEKVILKNSQGFEFEVSNSSVINKVINVMENELQQITSNSERQVIDFTI